MVVHTRYNGWMNFIFILVLVGSSIYSVQVNYFEMAPKEDVQKRVCIIFACATLSLKDKKVKPKRTWCKKWLLNREEYSHIKLLRNLRDNEPNDYRNFLRMTDEQFQFLLKSVEPYISKQDTSMRTAISAEERLVTTLRYLATGRSYEDLKFSAAMSPQAIGKIIPETCWAIFKTLRRKYLKMPSSAYDWKKVADGFLQNWQFEHCLGAIDGKHIQIEKPTNSGSLFYNYKGTFSVVLFAIVNSSYEFLYVHTGTNGRVSDGGILRKTDFYAKLVGNILHIPKPEKLEKAEKICPFAFIGDEAFPLMENFGSLTSKEECQKRNAYSITECVALEGW